MTDDSYKNKFLSAYYTYITTHDSGVYYLDHETLLRYFKVYTYTSNIPKLLNDLLTKAKTRAISFDTLMRYMGLFSYTSEYTNMLCILLPHTETDSKGKLGFADVKHLINLSSYASDKVKVINCIKNFIPLITCEHYLDMMREESHADERNKVTNALLAAATVTGIEANGSFVETLSGLFDSIEDFDSICRVFGVSQELQQEFRPSKTRKEIKEERLQELVASGAVTIGGNGGIRFGGGSTTSTITMNGNTVTFTSNGGSGANFSDMMEIMRLIEK